LVLAILALAAVSIQGLAADKVIINIAHQADIMNVDPAGLNMTPDRILCQNIYQGLIELDYQSQIVPFAYRNVLAESFEVSEDARVITFHLRKGIQFHHDYGEMTSADVAFSIMRHLDPKVASKVKAQYTVVDKVETPDAYTAIVYLKEPRAAVFLGTLAWQHGSIVSKKAAEELGDKLTTTPVAGTDAWEFVEWKAREEIVLRRFEKYWQEGPGVDELHFKIIPDTATAYLALEAGDVDIAPVEGIGDFERASAIPGVTVLQATATVEVYTLFLNLDKPVWKDVKVRHALAHAINITELASNLGQQFLAYPSPFNASVLGGTDEFWTYEYDPAKAKQLLAEAGYPNGFEITVIYYVGKYMEPFALEMQNYLGEIGIKVNLVTVERAVFSAAMVSMLDGKADAGVWSIGRPTTYLVAERFMTKNSANYYRYSNPEYDFAVNMAATSPTQTEETRWWRQAQLILSEDLPGLFPVEVRSAQAIRNNIKGVIPTGSSYFDYQLIRIEP